MTPKGRNATRRAGAGRGAGRPAQGRMSSDQPERGPKWFWWNLTALVMLIPFAVLVFERHLTLYVNQAILIGRAISL
jgi:hypothetical protein